MSRDKQIEEIELTEVDILANDLNQHCADLADNYCGGISCLACLAHAMIDKGYRKASEVAREIFNVIFEQVLTPEGIDYPLFAELEKKYTESEGVEPIYKHYTDTGAVYITSEPKESEDTECAGI
jgi:hypothetical protein